MPDIQVQGRPGVHQGYAQIVELQGLRLSRSQEGGCSCPEPERGENIPCEILVGVAEQFQSLKSAEEMEEEERAYQSAKLQELIRRGTPKDLQEANKLMKVMAGYDQRNKTDYRAKAAEEVGRVQQKARILEEMLQTYNPGDEIREEDVMEVCKQHATKI